VLTVDGLFSAVDVDGSGEISFDEFVEFWSGRQRAIGKHDDGTVAQMRSIFSDLDEDGSGARWHTALWSLQFRSCAIIAAGCMQRSATQLEMLECKPDSAPAAVDYMYAFEQVALIALSSRKLWSSSPAPNGSLPGMVQAAACITCTRRHAKRGGFRPVMTTQVGLSLITSEVLLLRLTAAGWRSETGWS
jgi:hypothetical protein